MQTTYGNMLAFRNLCMVRGPTSAQSCVRAAVRWSAASALSSFSRLRGYDLGPYPEQWSYFTMNVPMGWRVKTGLKPDGKFDIISYAITVYDPKRPERELYFCLNNAIGLKSVEAPNWYARSYGPGSYFAKMPVLTELSTAGFFAAMGPLFGYRQFTVLERLGRSALGGDVVVAECTTASGRRVQGLYHATVTSLTPVSGYINWK